MKAPRLRRLCVSGLIAVLAALLSSCYLFIGTPTSIAPQPEVVTILEPPTILSCAAQPIRTGCEDIFERICGWHFVTEPIVQTPDAGWVYTCWNAWRGTRCLFDLSIQLIVEDPSGDLRAALSPRVRLFDVRPLSAATSQHCLLNVTQTDIPIFSTDVQGSGKLKTVTVRLRNIEARFVGDCRVFGARFRVAIVIDADGREIISANTCEASVECRSDR